MSWHRELGQRDLSTFNKSPIKNLGTMKVLDSRQIQVGYMVIKLGNSVFSTDNKNNDCVEVSKLQFVKTEGVGHQTNIWLKGKFTMMKGHKPLAEPIPFELNVYCDIEGVKK